MLSTEFAFSLPRGLIDSDGNLHQQGTMRLATALDELVMQKDRRVQEQPAYGTLVMFSQVIVRLGSLPQVSPKLLEHLFTQDLAYLR